MQQPGDKGRTSRLSGGTRPDELPSTLAPEPESSWQHETGAAPSFRLPSPPPKPLPALRLAGLPELNERIDDFHLVRVLGEGSFARVYLAQQISLDRQVALKVSVHQGNEARTLAKLEHDHIVQVFQEIVVSDRNLLLLCMQYVPGTTLEQMLQALQEKPRAQWSGRAILQAVDEQSRQRGEFDPAALRDRELLASFPYVQAVCWLGICLAEALAHAHRQGILHRDIKPANILLSNYGRPLLADFNISSSEAESGKLGGTLAYMSPEHLQAFQHVQPVGSVREPADLYSLGVVLYELLLGEPFVRGPSQPTNIVSYVQGLTARRLQPPPRLRDRQPDLPEVLERVVRRCLEPDPAARFRSASELAEALRGCLYLGQCEQRLPKAGPITKLTQQRPLLMSHLLILLPHLLAAFVNVPYNALRVISHLNETQQAAFPFYVCLYNGIIVPICVGMIYVQFMPIYRIMRALASDSPNATPPTEAQIAWARRRALRTPFWGAFWSSVGWFPGCLAFPLMLHLGVGPVDGSVFSGFFTSIALSGLIAITYSLFSFKMLALRVIYPQLWLDGRQVQATLQTELEGQDRHLRYLQLLAGLIPLVGAIMMVAVSPDPSEFTPASYRSFRILVTGLILLGTLGFGLAMVVSGWLTQVLEALRGLASRQTRVRG